MISRIFDFLSVIKVSFWCLSYFRVFLRVFFQVTIVVQYAGLEIRFASKIRAEFDFRCNLHVRFSAWFSNIDQLDHTRLINSITVAIRLGSDIPSFVCFLLLANT